MEHLTSARPIAVHTAATTAPVVFSGYASTFGTPVDSYVPTIIEPGAFAKTLQENKSRIKVLWQHNADEPIGTPLDLFEDQLDAQVRARPNRRQAAAAVRALDLGHFDAQLRRGR